MLKKIISYGFFGVLTTIINIILFATLDSLGLNYKLSTVIAWILAVIFAYITNKKYVFKSKTNSKEETMKEFNSFLAVRLISLVIDLGSMFVLIEWLTVNNLIAKIISNLIVIIVNYFASEFLIFKNKK